MGMCSKAIYVIQHSQCHLNLPDAQGQVRGMFEEWVCGHVMQMRRVSRAWGARGRYWDGISAPKLLYSAIYMTMHLNIPWLPGVEITEKNQLGKVTRSRADTMSRSSDLPQ